MDSGRTGNGGRGHEEALFFYLFSVCYYSMTLEEERGVAEGTDAMRLSRRRNERKRIRHRLVNDCLCACCRCKRESSSMRKHARRNASNERERKLY